MDFSKMMFEQPEKHTIGSGIAAWVICFFIVPYMMVWLTMELFDAQILSYYVLTGFVFCFVLTLPIFFSFLRESLFVVSLDKKNFLKSVLSGTLQLIMVAVLLAALNFLIPDAYFFYAVPFSLCSPQILTIDMLVGSPIYAFIVLTFLTPVVICCLFYSSIFAPLCNNRPGMAYLVMALVLFIPHLVDLVWHIDARIVVTRYLLQPPLHLCACAIYQKTDSIWVPLCSLTLVNLLCNLPVLIAVQAGLIWLSA